MIIIGYLVIFVYIFLLLFVVGPLVKKFYNVECSRKVVHTSLFAIWIFFEIFLKGTIHQVIIPFIVTIMNTISNKFKIFKSIERDSEKCYGTIYFSIAVLAVMLFVLVFPQFYYCSGIAIFCLTFGDGFASLIGYNVKSTKIYKNKSLAGSIACFVASVISINALNIFYNIGLTELMLIVIGLAVVVFELIGKDFDNFTVTFSSFILSCIGIKFPNNNIAIVLGLIEIIILIGIVLKNNKEKKISCEF